MKNFPREMMHSNGVPMLLDSTRLMLVFQRQLELAEVVPFLAGLDLWLEDGGDERQAIPGEVVNHSGTRFFAQARRPITQERFEAIEKAALAFGAELLARCTACSVNRAAARCWCRCPTCWWCACVSATARTAPTAPSSPPTTAPSRCCRK